MGGGREGSAAVVAARQREGESLKLWAATAKAGAVQVWTGLRESRAFGGRRGSRLFRKIPPAVVTLLGILGDFSPLFVTFWMASCARAP